MTNPIKSWRRQKDSKHILGQKGKVLTWTKVFVSAPAFKDQTPYPVILVELEDGKKVYGQLVDYSEINLSIGQNVKAVLRILQKGSTEDIIDYGIKFIPV